MIFFFSFFPLCLLGTNTGRSRFHHHRNCWGQAVLLCWGLPSTVPEQKPRWILWTGRHRCRVSDGNQDEGLDSQKQREISLICLQGCRNGSIWKRIFTNAKSFVFQMVKFLPFDIFYGPFFFFTSDYSPHLSDDFFLRISTCQMSPSDTT